MTMQELSGQYAGTAEALYQRIAELRKQAAAAADPDDRFHLRRRIDELTPLWREARELANWTAHYYDRSYRVYAYYRI